MKDKATPRPWKLVTRYSDAEEVEICDDAEVFITALTSYDTGLSLDDAKANAELICRAVNSYSAMRLALENVWPILRKCGYMDEGVVIKEIDAALALARGETK